jgi:catechol 2,3-dioxygenase
VIGHVHLNVAEIPAAEAFYSGALGFDVVVRSYPGALFVSAGGYHHHLGLNTWSSAGGAPNTPDTLGLDSYTVVLPDAAAVADAVARLAAAGAAPSERDGLPFATDPFGNSFTLVAGA